MNFRVNINIENVLFHGFFLLFFITLIGCSGTEKKETVNAPEGMVVIPSGQFEMGGKSEQAYQDEFPRHKVSISAFLMDANEVTNSEFGAFVKATGYKTIAEKDIDWDEMLSQLPAGTPKPADSVLQAGSLVFIQTDGPVDLNNYAQWWRWTIGANWQHPEGPNSTIENRLDHPVVHIAWDDAVAYAKWADKRLPTEAEWEWASMGGKSDVKYPWGNESIEQATDKANFWQGKFPYQNYNLDGFESTAPIKSFPANGYGLFDMAGNVWEWCQDKYDVTAYERYAEDVANDPTGSEQYNDPREPYSPKHVIRGGSFLCNDSYCSGYRVARRMSSSKDSGFNHTGFRCVKDL
ncbi:MAG: sulfatase modifying factor 1 [Cyclobacteriaceae bacterium]|jgi:sulfatase modifying factor 1